MLQRSVRHSSKSGSRDRARDRREGRNTTRGMTDGRDGLSAWFPEEVGGQVSGSSATASLEQLARANASLWNVSRLGRAVRDGDRTGGPDRSARATARSLSARKIGAYGLSEPVPAATRAAQDDGGRDGDVYVIDGAKTFITNAPIADVFVIFNDARSKVGSRGITAFVVRARHRRASTSAPTTRRWVCTARRRAALLPRHACPGVAARRRGRQGIRDRARQRSTTVAWGSRRTRSAPRTAARSLSPRPPRRRTASSATAPIRGARTIGESSDGLLADAAIEGPRGRLMVYRRGHREPTEASASASRFKANCSPTEARRIADMPRTCRAMAAWGTCASSGSSRVYRDARITRFTKAPAEVHQRMVLAQGLLADT